MTSQSSDVSPMLTSKNKNSCWMTGLAEDEFLRMVWESRCQSHQSVTCRNCFLKLSYRTICFTRCLVVHHFFHVFSFFKPVHYFHVSCKHRKHLYFQSGHSIGQPQDLQSIAFLRFSHDTSAPWSSRFSKIPSWKWRRTLDLVLKHCHESQRN